MTTTPPRPAPTTPIEYWLNRPEEELWTALKAAEGRSLTPRVITVRITTGRINTVRINTGGASTPRPPDHP